MASLVFPSVGLQLLSALIYFFGITILSHCISRRLLHVKLFSLASLWQLSWSRLCLILVFLDSWLFLFSSGILIFGVGLELSKHVCSAAICLCIAFYATSKILTYFFLIERVHIVWAPPGARQGRFKSRIDQFCFVTVSLYTVVIALMLVGRISDLRENDDVCIIGLKPFSSIPLLSYDLYINILLTSLFFWPILKGGGGHLTKRVRRLAIRTFVASIAALTTSTANIGVLAVLHGHELGWLCLLSCGADVIVNSVALYWATSPRKKGQKTVLGPTITSFGIGTKELSVFTADGRSIPLQLTSSQPSQPAPARSDLWMQNSGRHFHNPFRPASYEGPTQTEVRITADQGGQPQASHGLRSWLSSTFTRSRRSRSSSSERARIRSRGLEVTITTQTDIQEVPRSEV